MAERTDLERDESKSQEVTIRLPPDDDDGGTGSSVWAHVARGLERYEKVEQIASGGMGVIYRAIDPDINRAVALKLIRPGVQTTSHHLRRFVMEGQVTGQLEHPNIVPLHEIGISSDGMPYFSMKMVRGKSLAEVLQGVRARGRSSRNYQWARLLRDFLKVCEAVAFAHARGVVHRDLKPANIMVGEFGEVLVMDWGLARVNGSEDLRQDRVRIDATARSAPGEVVRTLDGTVLGTPTYMPPEQARGAVDSIDHTSDIYSLGAILYEILTLTPPYSGRIVWEVIAQVDKGKLEAPRLRVPQAHIPRELEAVVLKAMAHDQRERYRRVELLKADIEAYLEGKVLSAVDYNPLQRLIKLVRRHRPASIAAAAVALLAALVFGVSRWADERSRESAELDFIAIEKRRIDGLMARLGRASGMALRRANHEVDDEAVERWSQACMKVLGAVEKLMDLQAHRPTEGALAALDAEGLRAQHLDLCGKAWRKAAGEGLYHLARAFVERAFARRAGEGRWRVRALAWIDRKRDGRISAGLAEARRLLDQTPRRMAAVRPHVWRRRTIDRLLRLRSPALVRLLLEKEYIDSPFDGVRLVVIEALGRLGDVRTRGPGDKDAVEAICERLSKVNLDEDDELAGAYGQAIVDLADSRAYAFLSAAVAAHPRESLMGRFLLSHLQKIPFPRDLEDGGARAPRTAPQLLHRAWLLSGQQLTDRALADVRRALRVAPDHPDALELASGILEHAGRIDDAVKTVRKLLAAGEKGALYHRLARLHSLKARWDQVRSACDRAISLAFQRADVYLLRGLARRHLGDSKGALDDFSRAIGMQPDHPDGYIERGRMYLSAGRYDQAAGDFTQAIGLAPDSASGAYLYRGMVHIRRRQWEPAYRDFTRCVRINGSHVSAFHNRGLALEKLGKLRRALQAYRMATLSQDYYWPGWYSCATLLYRLNRRAEAREAMKKAIRHAPDRYRGKLVEQLSRMR